VVKLDWKQTQEDGEDSEKPVFILNTHLRPPLSPTSPFMGLSLSAWFDSKEDRRNDSKKFYNVLLDAVKAAKMPKGEKPCIIVAGDFNEEENGLAYKYFQDDVQLRDARQEFDRQADTWHWPLLNGWYTTRAKYDHIFYSPVSLRCVGAKVRQEGSSDHYPVVATFVARDQEADKKERRLMQEAQMEQMTQPQPKRRFAS